MNPKTKKIVIISSVVAVAAVITGIVIILSRKKKFALNTDKGSTDVIVPARATTTSAVFPLKNGTGITTAERNAVKIVQRYLNAKKAAIIPLVEDGRFGGLTESALFKLTGLRQVSHALWSEMVDALSEVPALLSPNPPTSAVSPLLSLAPYKSTSSKTYYESLTGLNL